MNTFGEDVEKIASPSFVSDIGSSLGGTLSATQALLNGAVQDPELRRDLLVGMDYELRYLRFLFENWILLKTFQNGKIKLSLKKTNLSEWLTPILATWEKIAPEKKLQWTIRLDENLPEIYLDPDRLAQAFGNLIYASILCAPIASTIKIEVLWDDETVKLKIFDFGPKINPFIILDETDEIFEQHYENHPRLRKGLGLGIILAYRIMVAHQGYIKFDETETFNYCVAIELPV